MRTLAEEIVAALPALMRLHTRGPTVAEIASHIACPAASVRAALTVIKARRLAHVVRYSEKTLHVVPRGHFGPAYGACEVCDAFFSRAPRSVARCCSRSCANALGWRGEGQKEKRCAALSEAQSTPEAVARTHAVNKRRWSKAENREKLSKQNRREWADPAKKLRRSAAIQAKQGAPSQRKHYSEMRKADWKRPEYRDKCYAAATAAQRSDANRAKLSEKAKQRWANPEMRAKYIDGMHKSEKVKSRSMAHLHTPEARAKAAAARRKR